MKQESPAFRRGECQITVLKNFKPIFKEYTILVEGEQYHPYEFIKLLRNTKDGAVGVGLTQEISKTLEAAYATLVHQLSLVKSGGNKKGFLKAQRKLGQEEIDTLKRAWRNMYVNNSENVVVLNNVSGQIYLGTVSTAEYRYLGIFKNNCISLNLIAQAGCRVYAGESKSIAVSPALTNIHENDVILLAYLTNCSDDEIIGSFGGGQTFLTVDVVN